jgi:hypothetical protein
MACSKRVDTTFNTDDDGLKEMVFDTVRTLALQSDGDLIVGGDFYILMVFHPYLVG